MKYYVAVDIGCIECGQDTSILGIFKDKEKAELVCTEHEKRQKEDWHGQHEFEVFEVNGLNKVFTVKYRYEEEGLVWLNR